MAHPILRQDGMDTARRMLAIGICLTGSLVAAAPDAGGNLLRVIDAAGGCADFWRRAPGA